MLVGKNYNGDMAVETLDTLGERIRYAREVARLTQDEIAQHFNIRRVSVTQWEMNNPRPALERIGELAALLNTSSEWLVERKGYPPVGNPEARPRGRRPELIAGPNLVGDRDLPIYAAAMGGDGHIIVTFEAIDHVKRPTVLQNVRGGYGLLVLGDSMIPAYRPGDTLLVHPHLPPQRDTDCVFYHTPPAGGEAEAIIKRLNGFNDRDWKLEQYNPPREFTEKRVDWPICHRAVGKYNAR